MEYTIIGKHMSYHVFLFSFLLTTSPLLLLLATMVTKIMGDFWKWTLIKLFFAFLLFRTLKRTTFLNGDDLFFVRLMTGIEPPFRAHRREQDCRRHRRRQKCCNLPPASHWPVGYSQPATHLETDYSWIDMWWSYSDSTKFKWFLYVWVMVPFKGTVAWDWFYHSNFYQIYIFI